MKDYRLRDAIPETPPSFYNTVEERLSALCEQKQPARITFGLRKKWLLPLVAAAVLLISGTALAAGVWLRDNYSPTRYMETTREEREQQGKTIPDVEQAIESAAPQTGDCRIVMLPEFENAEEQNGWRLKMGQPAYSEDDWGWIREIRPQVDEVLIDGRTLAFNIRLNTDHAQSFIWPETEGQWVDALVDNISFRKEGDSMAYPIAEGGGGVNPSMVTDTSAVLYTDVILDQPGVAFPTSGRVELTVEIGIRDAKVDDMAVVGIVGKIYYTFSFDAAAGLDVAPAQVTERRLSGSAMLTVDDWTNPDNERLYNRRVSLDGVVLKEEIHYRQTGVYVTYTVQEAPESWTEAMKTALLYPNREGNWLGLYLTYRIAEEGEWLPCGHENHGNFGEQTVILPIFPSEYEKVKAQGCELRLTAYCGTALNGSPMDENWQMTVGAGAHSWDFTLAPQELITVPVPLPSAPV